MHTYVMTVTYRHATVDDPPGGGGGWGGWGGSGAARPISGQCGPCNTDFAVTCRPGEVLVIDVRGRTCPECNPRAEPAPGGSSGGGTDHGPGRTVKVWWASSSDSGSRWRVLDLDRVHGGAAYGPHRVPEGIPDRAQDRVGSAAVSAAWSHEVAPLLSAQLGAESWDAVSRAWQPGHCGILSALASTIDDVWANVVPSAVGGTRTVIRLVGVSPVLAALLPEAVTRSLSSGTFPFARIADLVQALGPTVCIGTGRAVVCDAVRRELGEISATPTPEALGRLGVPKVIRALAEHGGSPTIADVLRTAPAVTQLAPAEVKFPGGLIGSQKRMEHVGNAPTGPSTFGLS